MNNTKTLINYQIKFPRVRIVKDNESKIVNIEEARQIADQLGLDLILVTSNSNPPVCKFGDWNKIQYQESKFQKEQDKKARQSKIKVKEIRLSAEIGEHDFEFKLKHAINFLNKGNYVKLTLQLKGRQKSNPERGELTILKFIQELENWGIPQSIPKLENGRFQVQIIPK